MEQNQPKTLPESLWALGVSQHRVASLALAGFPSHPMRTF